MIAVGNDILFAIMMPMITPYNPRALAKISTINMLTKVEGV